MKADVWRRSLLAAALCLFAGVSARAQEEQTVTVSADLLVDLQRRLDAQEGELRRLRQVVGSTDSSSVSLFDNETPGGNIVGAGGSSPLKSLVGCCGIDDDVEGVDVSGEKFGVKVGGLILWDSTYGTDDGLADIPTIGQSFQNGHEFRSVRLFAIGKGFGIFDYKVEIDFAGFNNPVAKDVFMGAQFPIGHFKVGHFKEPFSMEQMASPQYTTFIESSLADAMVPARSMGMQLADNYGPDDRGYWAIGTFWDDLQQTAAGNDGDVDNQDEEFRSINARLTYLPIYQADGRYLVHVGGAVRHVQVVDPGLRFRARPEINDTFPVLGVAPGPDTDTYQQYGAELAGVWGPASLQAEYILTNFQNSADSMIDGFYIYGSYFLTGENRVYSKSTAAFNRVKPLENFWWVESCQPGCCHGMGAWELAARYSRLDWSDDGLVADGGARGELDNFTLGVNWYWNPYMRVMFNYIHSQVDDADTGLDADIDAFVTRFQVDF